MLQAKPLIVLLALICASCGATTRVLRQRDPNPYTKDTRFAVNPVKMTELTVDGIPESEFLSSKQEETAKWEAHKQEVSDVFRRTLLDSATEAGIQVTLDGPAQFTIQPSVTEIDTGYYRIPAFLAKARIPITLAIVDASGEVCDEIVVEDTKAFDVVVCPSTRQRLVLIAEALGRTTTDYLLERIPR
jgi:hypothetical protein